MNWDKLAVIRSMVLVLLGFTAVAAGAFLIYIPAGFIVLGVALVLLAYLTDVPAVKR